MEQEVRKFAWGSRATSGQPVSGVKAATCAPSKPNTHLYSPGIPRGQIPIRQIQELIRLKRNFYGEW